jgi:hypothetical protein
MSCDMKFDLKNALKSQNVAESDVFELSQKIKQFKHVPHSLSERKVCVDEKNKSQI